MEYSIAKMTSSWMLGYIYDFQNSGARVSASLDSEFRSTAMYSARMGMLPLNSTLMGQVDVNHGKHILGLVVQAFSPSNEEIEEIGVSMS